MRMRMLSCFGSSKKSKERSNNKWKSLRIQVEHVRETPESKTSCFNVAVPFPVRGSPACNVKVISHDVEVDYEGGDEHERDEVVTILGLERDHSHLDLHGLNDEGRLSGQEHDDGNACDDEGGHVSDPGAGKLEFWASPRLKRSCSDLVLRGLRREDEEVGDAIARSRSPVSVMTHCSADKVILKKHSSSQILPSHSRKLWWKLFLWSHRNLNNLNLHTPASKPSLNQQGGYCSDTVESRPTGEARKLALASPGSCSGDLIKTGNHSSMWTQNQWVALPTETSPFHRIEEWMNGISSQASLDADHDNLGIVYPPSPPAESISSDHPATNIPEEVLHANSIVQSLNASSSVAHMTGIGLKVIPSISGFSSLRSINLSGNCIVHIASGSLPKGLHVLNLSRNKINAIEGLRELSRLRVLDLSYNRISRIGQGLSNCTIIKQVYLSGNKISHVEGLHRLLKLTVLDLSFNKITTSKALGHLVANYNSLITLNLVGNPIQSNTSEEQLRRMVCSLLPNLAYLNKQAVNTQKAREVSANTMAALRGSSSSNTRGRARRKSGRRVQRQVSMMSTRKHNASVGAAAAQKAKMRVTKSFPQHRSPAAAAKHRPD